MDKKKMIAAVVAVLLGIATALTQIDFKGAICGGEAPAAQAGN